jgi:hypothetical protein
LRRLSEKTGIAESVVRAELGNWQAREYRKGLDDGLVERLSASRAQTTDDHHLLNLLIHYPHTMGKLFDHDCKVLLSDPTILGIFDSLHGIYANEGEVGPADMLDRLEGDSARERFREAMLSPPIYPLDRVEQAVEEFRAKIDQIKVSQSINKAREQGDLERLNQLLKLKCNGQFKSV